MRASSTREAGCWGTSEASERTREERFDGTPLWIAFGYRIAYQIHLSHLLLYSPWQKESPSLQGSCIYFPNTHSHILCTSPLHIITRAPPASICHPIFIFSAKAIIRQIKLRPAVHQPPSVPLSHSKCVSHHTPHHLEKPSTFFSKLPQRHLLLSYFLFCLVFHLYITAPSNYSPKIGATNETLIFDHTYI